MAKEETMGRIIHHEYFILTFDILYPYSSDLRLNLVTVISEGQCIILLQKLSSITMAMLTYDF